MRYPMIIGYHKITHSRPNAKHIFTTNLELYIVFFISTCGFMWDFTIPSSFIQSLYILVIITSMWAYIIFECIEKSVLCGIDKKNEDLRSCNE